MFRFWPLAFTALRAAIRGGTVFIVSVTRVFQQMFAVYPGHTVIVGHAFHQMTGIPWRLPALPYIPAKHAVRFYSF